LRRPPHCSGECDEPVELAIGGGIVFLAPVGPTAHAMQIEQFDKLAVHDQGDYIALLLGGAQNLLRDSGKNYDLAKLNKLFSEIRPGDETTVGMMEFEANLARARVLDAERYAKDHNATRLEVEHAMIVTLKKNGIILPPSFMHVMDHFKPKNRPK
jgi:hypothetical protein